MQNFIRSETALQGVILHPRSDFAQEPKFLSCFLNQFSNSNYHFIYMYVVHPNIINPIYSKVLYDILHHKIGTRLQRSR